MNKKVDNFRTFCSQEMKSSAQFGKLLDKDVTIKKVLYFILSQHLLEQNQH